MSGTNSSGVLDTLSGSYFQWLENQVFPYLFGSTLIIILLTGIILNSVLLYGMKRHNLQNLSGKIVFSQLIILDTFSYLFNILPSVIASFTRSWILPQPLCAIQGVAVAASFLNTFMFMSLLSVERLTKIRNPNIYKTTFDRNCSCVIACVSIWMFSFLVGSLPIFGWADVIYVTYQHRCTLIFTRNHSLIHVMFVLGFYIPFVISIGSFFSILTKRNQVRRDVEKLNGHVEEINSSIKHSYARGQKHEGPKQQTSNLKGQSSANTDGGGDLEIINNKDDIQKQHNCKVSTILVSEIRKAAASNSLSRTSPDKTPNPIGSVTSLTSGYSSEKADQDIYDKETDRNVIIKDKTSFSVYKGSQEAIDFRFSLTYFIMWLVLITIWLPYVILTYLRVYDVIPIWNGWITLSVLLTYVTYCIKPIIYVTQNNIFKNVAADSVPESFKKRASKARKVLRKATKKMDSLVFTQIKDVAAVTTVRSNHSSQSEKEKK